MNKKIIIGAIVAAVIVIGGVTAITLTAKPVVKQPIVNQPVANQPAANANTNANLEIANPASTYCVTNGGSLQIKTAPDGSQTGVCMFTDGSNCEEWAYMRGDCKMGEGKPTSTEPSPALNVNGPTN